MNTLLISLLTGSLVLGADDAKKDAEKLLGTWKVVGLQMEGQELLGSDVKEMRFVIAKDAIAVDGDFPDKDKYAKFSYKIDPTTAPKIIDVTIAVGDEKGTMMEGIYKLDGDKLQICVKILGKDRPGEFATKAGSRLVLATLERAKQ